jgi:hypothetical protein
MSLAQMPPHSSAAEVLLLDNKLASNAGPLASVKKNNALNGKSQEPATTASSFFCGQSARIYLFSIEISLAGARGGPPCTDAGDATVSVKRTRQQNAQKDEAC